MKWREKEGERSVSNEVEKSGCRNRQDHYGVLDEVRE